MRERQRPLSGVGRWLLAVALAIVAVASVPSPAPAEDPRELYLVTLDGPGLSGLSSDLSPVLASVRISGEQEALLASVGGADPVYRWQTALNGFAVELTHGQAELLGGHPDVTLVEPTRCGHWPASGGPASREPTRAPPTEAARAPSSASSTPASRLRVGSFAEVPGLGRLPDDFHATSADGDSWDPDICNGRADGRGVVRRRLRRRPPALRLRPVAARHRRPRHPDGLHRGRQLRRHRAGAGPVAGQLRRHGAAGPARGLQGVLGCPRPCGRRLRHGRPGDRDRPGHQRRRRRAEPLRGRPRRVRHGRARAPRRRRGRHRGRRGRGQRWPDGVRRPPEPVGDDRRRHHRRAAQGRGGARLGCAADRRHGRDRRGGPGPAGARVAGASTGATREAARVCAPGSLDAGAVADRIVVCERGTVGRVDKSRAVSLADGIGMVLVNDAPGSLDEDFHSVPTVHLAQAPGRDLVRWLAEHPRAGSPCDRWAW